MRQTWSLKLVVFTLVALFTVTLYSCGAKDSDIQKNVTEQLASTPGITATVSDGVVTLSGQVESEGMRSTAESNVKSVKGVKSVVNNVTVTPPQAPVVINPDETLIQGVNDAVKDFPSVNASVANGEITLTGTLQRSRLQTLMQSLNTLKPKKINNQLTLQ